MKMTLFVDASHHPKTLAGGAGAWVKRDDWSRGYTFGGELDVITPSSSSAELRAIYQAVRFIHRHGDLDDVEHLMLQCDNTNALSALVKYAGFSEAATKGRGVRLNLKYAGDFLPKERDWAREVGDWTSHMKTRQVRHVKGHEAGKDSRSWVNEKCDEIAKEHMRRQRAKIYGRRNLAAEGLRMPDTLCRVEEGVRSEQSPVLVGFGVGLANAFSQVPPTGEDGQ